MNQLFSDMRLLKFYLLLLLATVQPLAALQAFDLVAINEGDQIVQHEAYVLKYNEQYEQADWVAYVLTAEMLEKKCSRKDNFRSDPLVTTGSATLADYRGSGYDRGHLAPAADMVSSELFMSESFYMSNMSPQIPAFNRGVWKQLEEMVRQWARENGEIIVVTGPVLSYGVKDTIGPNEVGVPKYYFKVILDYTEPDIKAIAFRLPNNDTRAPFPIVATRVDTLEASTGLDFFPGLPDDIENEVEWRTHLASWLPVGPYVTEGQVVMQAPPHWLNKLTRVRHNVTCRYFANGKLGRYCRADEGRACRRCGG